MFASGATAVGDALIAQTVANQSTYAHSTTTRGSEGEAVSTIAPEQKKAKNSVFDSSALVELDSVVDTIAEDAVSASEKDESSVLDQFFAKFD